MLVLERSLLCIISPFLGPYAQISTGSWLLPVALRLSIIHPMWLVARLRRLLFCLAALVINDVVCIPCHPAQHTLSPTPPLGGFLHLFVL